MCVTLRAKGGVGGVWGVGEKEKEKKKKREKKKKQATTADDNFRSPKSS